MATPISQFDPRFELKKGFKSSQNGLVLELKSTLNEVVELSAPDVEKIQRISKQVFPLWLDYSMHRCRILVRLKGDEGQSVKDRNDLAQERSLTLTIQPLVGRYGNVEGLELENFKTIDGCAGESTVIP